MIYPGEVFVMNSGVLARQGRLAPRKPSVPSFTGLNLSWWKRSIRQPPQEREAAYYSYQAVHEEHPLEADKATETIHLLEASGDEAHDRGGDLGGCEIPSDPFPCARRRIE